MSHAAAHTRHLLAIEVSNPSLGGDALQTGAGVALGALETDGVRVLGTEPVRPSGRGGHDDDLMPAIDRLFARCGVSPRDGSLALVGCSVGPGGYTSVRVGCAVAKLIAEACGARCVGAPTASVVVEGLPAELRASRLAVALAGKGETAWVQAFAGGQALEPGRLMRAEDVDALHGAGVRLLVADRFLPEAMRRAAERAGMALREPSLSAEACLRVAARGPTIDPAELVPLYPREPDAVTLWRARKQG